MTLLDRFLDYVSIDTQSDPRSDTFPSTPGQTVMLKHLADQMLALGVADVAINRNGYVTGTIPATAGDEGEPVIGFLAHVDTSPDAPGANVRPQLTEKDGDTIVSTDGTTLLGADDKAGVAEIMTAADYLLSHPEVRHGKVRIAFTSDEEIGRGVDRFDVAAFGADFAYTMDGGAEGELEFENFNAADAIVSIRGRSIHPGDAKGRMVSALRVAMEFDAMLPSDQRPETTEGYEGFYHPTSMSGTIESARTEYIVRDHDRAVFEARKRMLSEIAERLDGKYGKGTVTLAVEDRYYNMREVLERHPEVVARAREAMRRAGVEPIIKPIRGGTDGARLSQMGLPCPNIFAGGVDFHSRNEHVSLRTMEKAVLTIVEIARVRDC